MNIFEQASRNKIRFSSDRGSIATEQLWDLPLTSKSGFDLDTIAKTVNAELKATAEESFVATSTNPFKAALELQLEVVKHIIAVRLQENADRLSAADKAQKKARLIEMLGRKQDAALEQLTPEEIQAQIEALG